VVATSKPFSRMGQRAMNVFLSQRLQKLKKSERGSAAIEFALILPVLAAILFGTIDFGRMMWFQEVLANATRVGARQATLFQAGNDQADVRSAISDSLTAGGIDPADLAVTVDGPGFDAAQGGNNAQGLAVNVNARVPFSFLVVDRLLPEGTVSNGFLNASVTMMME